jgi:GTPase SAR1 family protein
MNSKHVKRYMPLAPPRWLLKAKDPELFDREYRKQLDSLDAKHVAEDLGPNAILLCWESLNVRRHRRLVAEWLQEKLGIVVPELEHERAESLPFNQQPSKWDGKPSAAQVPMLF